MDRLLGSAADGAVAPAVRIRRLGPADLDAAVALRLEALENEPLAFCTTHEEALSTGRALLAKSLDEPERVAIFAAEVDGELVGMVSVMRESRARWQHRAGVYGMYVRAGHRGERLGAALLDAGLDFAKALGVRQVHLSADSAHTPAIALYRSRGFEVWGVEPAASRVAETGALLDEVHMVKVLT